MRTLKIIPMETSTKLYVHEFGFWMLWQSRTYKSYIIVSLWLYKQLAPWLSIAWEEPDSEVSAELIDVYKYSIYDDDQPGGQVAQVSSVGTQFSRQPP